MRSAVNPPVWLGETLKKQDDRGAEHHDGHGDDEPMRHKKKAIGPTQNPGFCAG
jgi:hypothetical protein